MASSFSLASGRAAGTGGGLLFWGTSCLFLLSGARRFGLLLDENVVDVLLLEAADILEALSRGLCRGDGEYISLKGKVAINFLV